MEEKLYITGHRNPDTDTICSTLAYSYYMSKRSNYDVQPIRIGSINRETQFVLDYFNVEPPRYKDSIKPQVRDLEMDRAYTISKEFSLNKALSLMQESKIDSLPVIDDSEHLIGIVSLSDITKTYMEIWDDGILGRSETAIENILQVLNGKELTDSKKRRPLNGKMTVYAMDPKYIKDYIQEDDVVIIGDREDAQADAIEKNVACIILTGGYPMDEDLIKEAEKRRITVLSTGFNSFMTARLLPQSVPVNFVMTRDNLVTFNLEDTVDEVQAKMSNSRYSSYPVLNHKKEVVGLISRYHLISYDAKKLILVDHNEKSQSIDDIDSAEIVEIIDHHRVANIHTSAPVFFRNEPVGSTATIISKIFLENGIRPPKAIAGLLSAAIISDTLLFKSPTSTDEDKKMLNTMSKIAMIDPKDFAIKMFKAGTSLENVEPIDLLTTDVKEFTVEKENVRVAQAFTMDLDNLADIRQDLVETMQQMLESEQDALIVLLLTDIFQETSEVIAVGKYAKELAEVFDQELVDHSFMAEGLLSRKKQMIPKLNQAIIRGNKR